MRIILILLCMFMLTALDYPREATEGGSTGTCVISVYVPPRVQPAVIDKKTGQVFIPSNTTDMEQKTISSTKTLKVIILIASTL